MRSADLAADVPRDVPSPAMAGVGRPEAIQRPAAAGGVTSRGRSVDLTREVARNHRQLFGVACEAEGLAREIREVGREAGRGGRRSPGSPSPAHWSFLTAEDHWNLTKSN